MRCTNRPFLYIFTAILTCLSLVGCSTGFALPFDPDSQTGSFNILSTGSGSDIKPFAADICVCDNDFEELKFAIEEAEAGGLFDATDAETVYAKNVHAKLNPASLTKVITA